MERYKPAPPPEWTAPSLRPSSSGHAAAPAAPPDSAAGIANLRTIYDAGLSRFEQRRAALASNGNSGLIEPAAPPTITAEPGERRYPTCFGAVPFAEIMAHTQRIAGYTLRETLGMTNPQDIDDCLQSAYFKLWRKLQADPDHLAGKPKRYLVKAVVFRSKAQRFAHQRHYRKLDFDTPAVSAPPTEAWETPQIDTWMDLEKAIVGVAHRADHHLPDLLGLYAVLTQTALETLAGAFGVSRYALTKSRQQTRTSLAAQLDGYGPYRANHTAIPTNGATAVGESDPVIGRVHDRELLTSRFWRALHDLPARRTRPTADLGRESVETQRLLAAVNRRIRTQLRPFQPPGTFPTGWGGALPFEAIASHPEVRRSAFAKVRRLGVEGTEVEDCVQQGLVKLWQQLGQRPDLLADKGPVWAGLYVAYSGDTRRFIREQARQCRQVGLDWAGSAADEPRLLDVNGAAAARRADWTQTIDERLDVERFLRQMGERFAEEPVRLLGLYALTTTVKTQDVAALLGIAPNNFAAMVGQPLRRELQSAWAASGGELPPEPWTVRLARGEGLEHVRCLAEQVQDDLRRLLALYIVTTAVTRQAVLTTFQIAHTPFSADLKWVRQQLAAAYRRRPPV